MKSLNDSLELSMPEIVMYQNKKSLAQLEGKISLEEATSIYNALMDWNSTTIEMKIAVTMGMSEIIGLR